MTKKEKKLIEDLARYATTHQHESVYLVEIAYALWRIENDQLDLAQVKYLMN